MTDAYDLEGLTDERKLSERRKAAEEEYKDFSAADILLLRRRCKADLFFFAKSILGYNLISPNLHGTVAQWLELTRETQYRMLLMPRGHYKSTIATIAESVQMALPNDAEVPYHPYSLGPNVRLLLAHETKDSAARFLFEIASAFLNNPAMLALFPECIPSRARQRINTYEMDLPRTRTNIKEPTFDTIGANGAAQGRHYDHIKLDDIIGDKARDSQTIMGRTISWFNNINSLLTRLKIDGIDIIGTRWSGGDVYNEAFKRYGVNKGLSVLSAMFERDVEKLKPGPLAVYARGAIEDSEPIFPEEFTMEALNLIRQDPIVWAAQYANNPRETGLNEFSPSWLRFYQYALDGRRIVFHDGDGLQTVNPRALRIYAHVDPAMSETSKADHTGIVIVGLDHRGRVFVLETLKARFLPPDIVSEIFRIHHQYNPEKISIEEVAFSGMLKYWIDERAEQARVWPRIVPYKPGTQRKKITRIKGLTNFFAAGMVYILEGMSDFRDEYEWFPRGEGEHLLDALAQGPDGIWEGGMTTQDAIGVTDKLMALPSSHQHRSAATGY